MARDKHTQKSSIEKSNLKKDIQSISSTKKKVAAKRHRRKLSNNILGIRKPPLERLGRRAGVRRISREVYPILRELMMKKLKLLVKSSIIYMESAKRKTVSIDDVGQAFSTLNDGKKIHGYPKFKNAKSKTKKIEIEKETEEI